MHVIRREVAVYFFLTVLFFHTLSSLAALVAFTLPYHKFAYSTGLQCMTNYYY